MQMTIEKHLQVPMRDGVMLATDVYRPAGAGPFPVVMMRLPYNKEQPVLLFLAGDILRVAQAGYAVVVQDCRGTWASEGEFSPYFQEAEDGADAIAWAAAQVWSTGDVGMMGASYYGATQWLAATQAPPALKAIAPFITTDQYHEKWTYQGGAFQLGFMLQWASVTFGVAEAVRRVMRGAGDAAGVRSAIGAADAVAANYWHLPLCELPEVANLTPYVKDWLAHPDYDYYWRAAAPCEHYENITTPALNFGGWYDLFLGGTLANYAAMKGRTPQKLVIGPWVHGYNGGVYPARNFGLMAHDGVADVTAAQIRWFDHFLKGQANGVLDEPPVKIFVMGPDVWREEADWPLPDTDWQQWYLHSAGSAGTKAEDGVLAKHTPGDEPADSYLYDPRNPVPTVGGASFLPGLFIAANAGPRDQREVEQRADVLCYTSDGILRARYRDSLSTQKLMTPGEVYRIEIDLVATANVFAAGHRIRLEVSSANFPRFDRNTNSGGVIAEETEADFVRATNTVWHDDVRASHLILPVIARR